MIRGVDVNANLFMTVQSSLLLLANEIYQQSPSLGLLLRPAALHVDLMLSVFVVEHPHEIEHGLFSGTAEGICDYLSAEAQ